MLKLLIPQSLLAPEWLNFYVNRYWYKDLPSTNRARMLRYCTFLVTTAPLLLIEFFWRESIEILRYLFFLSITVNIGLSNIIHPFERPVDLSINKLDCLLDIVLRKYPKLDFWLDKHITMSIQLLLGCCSFPLVWGIVIAVQLFVYNFIEHQPFSLKEAITLTPAYLLLLVLFFSSIVLTSSVIGKLKSLVANCITRIRQ